MLNRRTFLAASAAAGATSLAGCASKFRAYTGPEVTQLLVSKTDRRLFLLSGNSAVRTYNFQLGFSPEGHKQFEGDGKTPEGVYWIDRHNPDSRYHLSVGISYPDAQDRAFAASMGRSPGGDIFIHGTPKEFVGQRDWTAGCIAVSDEEIEEIYAAVQPGTQITLLP
ncbi:L,D-transpeptidase family protein [Pseudoroseicyclus sp. H15]